MKKIFLFIVLIVITITFTACNNPSEQRKPWYNELPVGDEPFEAYKPSIKEVVISCGLVIDYENLDTYIEQADLVVVGYPENTFTSEPFAYYSRDNGFVDINDDWYTLDTIRKIRVLDVLKGEIDTDSINLHVKEVTSWNEDGSFEIKELDSERFIQKKNVKYIFILKDTSHLYNGQKTYYAWDSINVDGLHLSSLEYVNGGFMKRIMEKYGDYFVKYNRADIQVTDITDDSATSVYNTYMQSLTETKK